jgi:hypothetical protein
MSSPENDQSNDIQIIKEVIDELQEEQSDIKMQLDRLEEGQQKVLNTLDMIVGKFEKNEIENAAKTIILDDFEKRLCSLEK